MLAQTIVKRSSGSRMGVVLISGKETQGAALCKHANPANATAIAPQFDYCISAAMHAFWRSCTSKWRRRQVRPLGQLYAHTTISRIIRIRPVVRTSSPVWRPTPGCVDRTTSARLEGVSVSVHCDKPVTMRAPSVLGNARRD